MRKRRSAVQSTPQSSAKSPTLEPVLEGVDASLLDIVDHVLTKGIVLTGDLVLGVADIDLVYLRLSAVLCAADRILVPSADAKKRRARHAASTAFGRASIAGALGDPSRRRAARRRRDEDT